MVEFKFVSGGHPLVEYIVGGGWIKPPGFDFDTIGTWKKPPTETSSGGGGIVLPPETLSKPKPIRPLVSGGNFPGDPEASTDTFIKPPIKLLASGGNLPGDPVAFSKPIPIRTNFIVGNGDGWFPELETTGSSGKNFPPSFQQIGGGGGWFPGLESKGTGGKQFPPADNQVGGGDGWHPGMEPSTKGSKQNPPGNPQIGNGGGARPTQEVTATGSKNIPDYSIEQNNQPSYETNSSGIETGPTILALILATGVVLLINKYKK